MKKSAQNTCGIPHESDTFTHGLPDKCGRFGVFGAQFFRWNLSAGSQFVVTGELQCFRCWRSTFFVFFSGFLAVLSVAKGQERRLFEQILGKKRRSWKHWKESIFRSFQSGKSSEKSLQNRGKMALRHPSECNSTVRACTLGPLSPQQ